MPVTETKMIATAEMTPMGRGRPKNPEGTRQVKLFGDLAIMIAEIVEMADDPKVTAASLCDPLLRPQITARHARVKPQLEQIRKAKAAAKKASADDDR